MAGLAAAAPLAAAEIMFSASQWGDVNLRLEQSTERLVESVLTGNPNFEPLAVYAPGSRLRRLSRPVGRLDILFASGMTTCTAWLISDSLIITNHHCIPGDRPDRPVKKASFLLGYYSQTDTRDVEREAVHLEPVETSRELDYSILKVDGAPGKRWGTVKLTDSTPRPGEPLIVIHHPAGQPMQVTRGSCRAGSPRPVQGAELFHKCDTLPGSSGAVILDSDFNAAIALHYAGSPNPGPERYNYGKLIGSIEARSATLRRIIAAESAGAPRTPAPSPDRAHPAVPPVAREAAPAVTMVPPEFKLFGETVKIVYVAERKSQAEALSRRLREMYAIVEINENWQVPQRLNNRIVVQPSKAEVAQSIATLARGISTLDVEPSADAQSKEIVIWLGAP